ncbi:MAG: cytochrome b/b6 domain-containing protein [Acidobacteriia bacterium]|nr:cytochrome b/b6 domain-containing protein [Terriglobia bacterium]
MKAREGLEKDNRGSLGQPAATISRLTLWQRWEHGLMALSVTLLILSGLALAYHEQAWARLLIRLMGGLEGRHWVHRASAIGLLVAGLLHFSGLILSERHQRDFHEVKPRLNDFRAAWGGLKFAFSGRGEPPPYGWFTPMQKLQYWGVLIGCLLMGVSGALLWNPVITLNSFPKWVLDIMLVLHATEAQFIFVLFILWHLYDVHLAGGNFPMNPAWLTGKMSEELFVRQHRASMENARSKEEA